MAQLQVTNGDSAAHTLRELGLPGELLVWRDILHAGPVPAVGPAELRVVRAEYLSAQGYAPYEAVLTDFTQRDAALDGHDGDFLLWFEADLYDQLQLIEVLSQLRARGVEAGRVWLVCIGEYPGIANFGGLGELTVGQLATLADTARPLTEAAMDQAADAWAAFRSPTPERLGTVVNSPELRFLGDGFDRLAREYPWTRDGLSLTERRALAATPPEGISRFELFVRVNRRETRPYLGDTSFFAILAGLTAGAEPLLAVDDDRARLTPLGRAVLAGEAQRPSLDRWLGGVNLIDDAWRFDDARERVVRYSPTVSPTATRV